LKLKFPSNIKPAFKIKYSTILTIFAQFAKKVGAYDLDTLDDLWAKWSKEWVVLGRKSKAKAKYGFQRNGWCNSTLEKECEGQIDFKRAINWQPK